MDKLEALRARVSNRALAVAWSLAQGPLVARALSSLTIDGLVSRAAHRIHDGGIAVVQVVGYLASRADEWDLYFGLCDYATVVARVIAALEDPASRGVVIEVDSFGGDAAGAFDCRDEILAAKAASGKPVWVVAKEAACSSGYLIATTGDRIVATQTAQLGSVGVMALHCDQSGYDAKIGAKYTYIKAGAKKTDGNPHEPLSAEALADLQADIESLYSSFVTAVSESRGVTEDEVRAQEAAVYRGQAAVDAKLADEVGTLDGAIAALAAQLAPPAPPAPTEPTPAAVVEPPVVTAASETERAAELTEIAALARKQGVDLDLAKAIRDKVSPDALRRQVLETLADRSEANPIIVAAPLARTPGDGPLKRAATAAAAAAGKRS
ncbi:hypothetical protein sos41_11800 [Alphaproteobacteria bacterium SO-S41]|nr:hypothetical protein sos41_11800 [Alphaproteobacteria bacterium SO-S41]